MAGVPVSVLVDAIQPKSGQAWHGGPTPLGALRGVAAEEAAWQPGPRRKSIWVLTLHIAYWKYAVRRLLDGSERGRFPRGPSNWPRPVAPLDQGRWAEDVALLREEHEQLVRAAAAVAPARLSRRPPGSKRWTYGELLVGIAMHDAYHTGQIQLVKRLWREREITL
jgi:DinB superfamily